MNKKIFNFIKNIYKRIPVNYKLKVKMKGIFYRCFGFMLKNNSAYKTWQAVNFKSFVDDVVKVKESDIKELNVNEKVLIHLHLYYIDLLDEFISYLNNVPFKFDIIITVVDNKSKEYIYSEIEKIKNVKKVEVMLVENRGRDVAPLLSLYDKGIFEYEYICHIHSKKSIYTGSVQNEWREYLLKGLLGSRETILSHFYMFEKKEKIGLIYPETYEGMSYWAHTWLKNVSARNELMQRIGVNYVEKQNYIDYPMGTMFWARTEAIRQFFEAKIEAKEFQKENGQKDGTIAHAFERCLTSVCSYNGYNYLVNDTSNKCYQYNNGNKNFHHYWVKEHEQICNEVKSYEVITFDIFDTLISRNVVSPDDVFDLMGVDTDFKKLRKQAELNCRMFNPENDCDLDDIYKEYKKITGKSIKECEELKKLEIEMELLVSVPREKVVEDFNFIKDKLKKKIILISDMYLRKNDIIALLEKNGIFGYDDIWISSETNLRKDNQLAWEYLINKNNVEKIYHIGDNEVSDLQIPNDLGILCNHIMSPNDLFSNSNIGRKCRVNTVSDAVESVVYGLVIQKIGNDPFGINHSKFNIEIIKGRDLGYCIFAPIIIEYVIWLVQNVLKDKRDKIMFMARDGYLLKEVFDVFKQSVPEISHIESKYVYASRRAFSVASIKSYDEIEDLLDTYYMGTLSNLIFTRFGIKEDDNRDLKMEVKLPDDKEKIRNYIKKFYNSILKNAEKEKEELIKYFNSNVGEINNSVISDIGYSGTIQYYLSKLLGKPFDGYYFATDNKRKPLEIDGSSIKGFYIDGDECQGASDSLIHRYHLVLESILVAPTGQFVRLEKGKPIFVEEYNSLYDENISEIHKGIMDFTYDFTKICKSKILKAVFNKKITEQLINCVVEKDIIKGDLYKSMCVEDSYCSDLKMNVLDYYKKNKAL